MSWIKNLFTYPLSVLCITLGVIYGTLTNHTRADNFFNIALKLTPNYGLAYWGKAISQKMLGNYQQALFYANGAAARKVNNPKFYNSRGLIYLEMQQYQAALNDFATALHLNPNKIEPYLNNAVVFIGLKDYNQAFHYCELVLERNPRKVIAYLNRGVIYQSLNNFAQAQADYQRCLELNPKYALAYNNLAALSLKTKNYANALQFSQQALTLDPKMVSSYVNRSLGYLFLNQVKAATDVLTTAVAIEENHLEARALLFWLSLGTKSPNESVVLELEQLININPYDTYAIILRAIATGMKGNWEDALKQLRVPFFLIDEEIYTYFWQGLALAFQSKNNEAIQMLDYAIYYFVPPTLLNPLFWLEQERPEFYQQYLLPLLKRRLG